MTLNRIIAGNIILIKVIDRFPLGKTILMGLPIMLLGTLFLVVDWHLVYPAEGGTDTDYAGTSS